LHSNKILHRDIKTINVFLSSGDKVKLGDLGVAKMLNQTANFAHTIVGTPYYLSPELCEEKPYNHKSDIWSLGCVLYEMCTLRHPFEANNQGALILKIVRGKFDPIPSTFSKELSDMVNALLTRDYKKRPSIQEVLES
jgi:NIMA (never in mitosis gene a)-related kinase